MEQRDIGWLAMALITRQDGSINWPVIIGGIITAGVLGTTKVLFDINGQIESMKAKNDALRERVMALETNQAPATAKRFTSDDALALERRLDRRIERLENMKESR